MHILQGLLVLFLLPAAAGAATPFDKMIGDWTGTVTSDDGCEWKVASAVIGGGSFSGGFTFSGECADGKRSGLFKIKPSGKSCYSATVNLGGMPIMPVSGCADKAGNISFKTAGFSGKLTFAKGSKTFSLKVAGEKGSASGQFRRMARKKRRPVPQTDGTEVERGDAGEAIGGDAEGRGRPQEDEEEEDAPQHREKDRNDKEGSSEVLIGGY